MALRESTVVFLCAALGVAALAWPMPVFAGDYDGIAPGEVAWVCAPPVRSLAPPPVDLDALRRCVATAREQAADGRGYVAPASAHPLCGALARTQAVLALLAFAGAAWRAVSWRRATADARAQRRFERLHSGTGRDSAGPRSRIPG